MPWHVGEEPCPERVSGGLVESALGVARGHGDEGVGGGDEGVGRGKEGG